VSNTLIGISVERSSTPHHTPFAASDETSGGALEIELSTRCNLHCPQCPRVSFDDVWIERDMPRDVFERIAPFTAHFDEVRLQGWGEPLLNPRVVDIVRAIRFYCRKLTLSTNGVLPVPVEVLESVDTLNFRLTSGKARTYEIANPNQPFNRTLFNISKAIHWRTTTRRKSPRIVLSLLKNAVTLRELPEYIALAARLRVDRVVLHEPRFHVRPVDEEASLPGRLMPDMVEKREQALKRLATGLGVDLIMDAKPGLCPYNPGRDLFLNWKGQVSPCRYSHLPVVNDHYSFYKDGKLKHVRPLYFGYLVNKDQVRRWQQRTNRLIRLFSQSMEPSSLPSCLPKLRYMNFDFTAKCPMRNLPSTGYHGLCI
jgi:MoaA/NifB/PqqE/SkfB family radical SAM enzyme